MAEILQNNQKALRYCILYEVLDKKPVFESYKSLCKKMGNHAVEYIDFEYWFYRFYQGKLDLEYDRSLDPKPLLFSDLPIETVDKIVGKLDFLSRLSIRKVSRVLRSLVDQQKKSSCNFVFVAISSDHIAMKFDDLLLSYLKTDNGCMVSHDKDDKIICKGDFFKMALNDLSVEMKNPNFQLQELNVTCFDSSTCNKFFNSISNGLISQVHAKSLVITSCNTRDVKPVLSCLKAGTLEEIELISSKIAEKSIKQMVKMEQWKQAKTVNLTGLRINSSYLERFLHFTHFMVFFKSFEVDDIITLRYALSKSTNFHFCQINVLYHSFTPIEIGKALGIQVPLNFIEDIVHRFPIPHSNQFLEFTISGFCITVQKTH